MVVEIVVAAEDRFGLLISGDDWARFKTVPEATRYSQAPAGLWRRTPDGRRHELCMAAHDAPPERSCPVSVSRTLTRVRLAPTIRRTTRPDRQAARLKW
jgi:hypothetical protein